MVERVAAAIMNVGLDKNAKYAAMAGWEHADEGDKEVARDFARAAIEAMREPTEAMQKAGYIVTVDDEVDVWQTMIDAALT